MELKQDYMVVPEFDIAERVLETDLDNNITSVYKLEMIKRDAKVQFMQREIERLESLNDGKSDELINSKKMFLKGKQLEYDYMKMATGIKIAYLDKKMDKEDYSKLRDNILTNIILERAKLKRYLSHIKLYAKRNSVDLDKEWFESFDTIVDDIHGSLDDCVRFNEIAKNSLSYLNNCIKNGDNILPDDDTIKDAMLSIALIPTYLARKEIKGRNK